MLAVDNGNVEVYDRHSLELKTALVGQVGEPMRSLLSNFVFQCLLAKQFIKLI